MKLNKILHPELVLDLRGPENYRLFFRDLLQYVSFVRGGGYTFDESLLDIFSIHGTDSIRENILISWKFKKERPPVYHVGKEFVQAIAKIDRDIPLDLLPEKFFAYFSFAEKSMWDGSAWVQGIYVYIGPQEESALRPALYNGNKIFWAVYITEEADDGHSCARLLMDLDNEKFSELVSKIPIDKRGVQPGNEIFLTGLNLALYVNSIDCDLLKVPPMKALKPAAKKELVKSGNPINQCLIPVTLVSWQYQNPRRYLVDSIWVDTFMRWQRCGPGFTQLKLIWVKPHERKFDKGLNEKTQNEA